MSHLTQLGRYEIVGELGAGAMGVVYDARDPKLGRRLAIKTIRVTHLDDPTMAHEYQMRFEREARAVALLQHPNIVSVYDYGEQDGIAYLVLEFVQGRELGVMLGRSERLSEEQAASIMQQLLDALGAAHAQGIVHRDIKPANILIEANTGKVKLTDFGVARIQSGMEATKATVVGTLKYMSPEQILGQAVDGRADIFAAGVVLYQMLTGNKPFDGATEYNVQHKIVKEDPTLPTALRPQLSTGWDVVLARALAKDRDQRYRSAADFAHDIDCILQHKPLPPLHSLSDATVLNPPTIGFEQPRSSADISALSMPMAAQMGTVPPTRPTATPPTQPTQPSAPLPPATDATNLELEFWRTIQDSQDPLEYELYLKRFPAGFYSDLAAARLNKLRSGQAVSGGTVPGIQIPNSAPNNTPSPVKPAAVVPTPVDPAVTPPAPAVAIPQPAQPVAQQPAVVPTPQPNNVVPRAPVAIPQEYVPPPAPPKRGSGWGKLLWIIGGLTTVCVLGVALMAFLAYRSSQKFDLPDYQAQWSVDVSPAILPAAQRTASVFARQHHILPYNVNPQLQTQLIKQIVDSLKVKSPFFSGIFETTVQGDNYQSDLGKELARYGLNVHDTADALAAFWIINWLAAHREDWGDKPTADQLAKVRAVRGQAAYALTAAQWANANSDQRQTAAQSMLMYASLVDLAAKASKDDKAQSEEIATTVRTSTQRVLGVDLIELQLTSYGFVRR